MQALIDLPTNTIPVCDPNDRPTGCCPRFHPDEWQDVVLHFDEMPFVRASSISFMHLPLNMGSIFSKIHAQIEQSDARSHGYLVLTHHRSPWHEDHLFAVDHPIEGADMAYLDGTFRTKVFTGSYGEVRHWHSELLADIERSGKHAGEVYWFYTTCPTCAKAYGVNYVVGIAHIRE